MKAIVHVNKHKIRAKDPKPISVKTYKSNVYTDRVVINGPLEVVTNYINPLKCGATVWIECKAEDVVIYD